MQIDKINQTFQNILSQITENLEEEEEVKKNK